MTDGNVDEIRAVGKALVEQHGDFFREAMAWALRETMEAQVRSACGAGSLPLARNDPGLLAGSRPAGPLHVCVRAPTLGDREAVLPGSAGRSPPVDREQKPRLRN
ncbi:MAG: hypothetical protein FJ087_02810 [Deltaproteobacteria bacterium]|nr:hypothetical protein [Deltaproteobacteria bacterium]